MFLKTLIYFPFEYCKLFFFVKHRENNICEVFIGVSNTADKLSDYRFFLSRNIDFLFISKTHFEDIKRYFTMTIKNGRLLQKVNIEDHEKIRDLASEITNKKLYKNLIACAKYYKFTFDMQVYKNFCFEIISFKKKTQVLSWEHSQSICLDREDLYGILDLISKKSLDMNKDNFDKLCDILDQFTCLGTSSNLSKFENHGLKESILIMDCLNNTVRKTDTEDNEATATTKCDVPDINIEEENNTELKNKNERFNRNIDKKNMNKNTDDFFDNKSSSDSEDDDNNKKLPFESFDYIFCSATFLSLGLFIWNSFKDSYKKIKILKS
ncbi:putative SP-containing membrane protein [Vairimorpha necatrix]|uniref:SP-containing membrane protein n=1 Tax=Vairimorpha necatrix TaxID=6039 RepID=A0AAX4JEN8_9MICR